MNKIILALLAGTAMMALVGCKTTDNGSSSGGTSGGGEQGGGDTPSGDDGNYTVGGTTVQIENGSITSVADTGGDYTESDDGDTITVAFTSGPYAGQSVTFSDGNDTTTLDGEDATLEAFLGADDDTSSGALYITVGSDEDIDGSFIGLYSGDAVSDMPQEGTGTYQGDYFGSATNASATGLVSGSTTIDVNFQDGTVSGDFTDLTIYEDDVAAGSFADIGFSGALDKNSGAYTADSVTIGGAAADAGSVVKGSLYGSGADSTAGSATVFDDMDSPSAATTGVFQADLAN